MPPSRLSRTYLCAPLSYPKTARSTHLIHLARHDNRDLTIHLALHLLNPTVSTVSVMFYSFAHIGKVVQEVCMSNVVQPRHFSAAIELAPQARWAAAAQYVEGVRDALGKPVDAGIKSLVLALNASGFPTTASCEGHLDWGIPAPWVDLGPWPTPESVAHRRELRALDEEIESIARDAPNTAVLDELYEKRRLLSAHIRRPTLVLAHPLMALLAAFYGGRRVPYDQMISLHLRVIGMRMQCHGSEVQDIALPAEKTATLERYRAEMQTFAAFLAACPHGRHLT